MIICSSSIAYLTCRIVIGYPDIDLSIPTTTTTYKSTSVSVVASGVIGAVIGAVLVPVLVFLYLRILRYRKNIQIHRRAVSNTQKATRPVSFATASYARRSVSTVYSSFNPTMYFAWTQSDQVPQSTMVQMSVQRVTNGATMNSPKSVIAHFSFLISHFPPLQFPLTETSILAEGWIQYPKNWRLNL